MSKRQMKLGVVVDDHWGFIRELLSDWQERYETRVFTFKDIRLPVFHGRVNRRRLTHSLKRFLESSDVVVFEWAGPLLVVASNLRTRARIVVRLHSYELFDYAPRIRWESVSRVVLVSEAMQRHFCRSFPASAGKTSVIYNGVELSRFQKPERQFSGTMGMLGNLIPIKRVYEVILVLYELNKIGQRLKLQIAGPCDTGADAERYWLAIQRAVRNLELEQQVCFVGKISDPERFLRDVDIFISNSYWEGQQLALLEAMATGCYCLAHFWDGADEVLPRGQLYVTDTELREKILAYVQMPEITKRQYQEEMRAKASSQFDIERTKVRMRETIEQVANARLR